MLIVKQLRRADWIKLFESHPPAMEQAFMCMARRDAGQPLASYEVAAIQAYEALQERLAA